jgi:hypothetical protein
LDLVGVEQLSVAEDADLVGVIMSADNFGVILELRDVMELLAPCLVDHPVRQM